MSIRKSVQGWFFKYRYILTILSVTATVIGIYVNAALNFHHLFSDRAKIAYDRLEAINNIRNNIEDVSARYCFKYANESKLGKQFLSEMWRDYMKNSIDLPINNSLYAEDLYECLNQGGDRGNAALASVLNYHPTGNSTANLYYSRLFSKTIFGYMNSFEPSADMSRKNKMDTSVFCDQIAGIFDDDHDMLLFIKGDLQESIGGMEAFGKGYPGLRWYIERGKDYCKDGRKRFIDNVIAPVLPIFGRND